MPRTNIRKRWNYNCAARTGDHGWTGRARNRDTTRPLHGSTKPASRRSPVLTTSTSGSGHTDTERPEHSEKQIEPGQHAPQHQAIAFERDPQWHWRAPEFHEIEPDQPHLDRGDAEHHHPHDRSDAVP